MGNFVIIFSEHIVNKIEYRDIYCSGTKGSLCPDQKSAKWVKYFVQFLLPQTKRNHMKYPRFLCMGFGLEV